MSVEFCLMLFCSQVTCEHFSTGFGQRFGGQRILIGLPLLLHIQKQQVCFQQRSDVSCKSHGTSHVQRACAATCVMDQKETISKNSWPSWYVRVQVAKVSPSTFLWPIWLFDPCCGVPTKVILSSGECQKINRTLLSYVCARVTKISLLSWFWWSDTSRPSLSIPDQHSRAEAQGHIRVGGAHRTEAVLLECADTWRSVCCAVRQLLLGKNKENSGALLGRHLQDFLCMCVLFALTSARSVAPCIISALAHSNDVRWVFCVVFRSWNFDHAGTGMLSWFDAMFHCFQCWISQRCL